MSETDSLDDPDEQHAFIYFGCKSKISTAKSNCQVTSLSGLIAAVTCVSARPLTDTEVQTRIVAVSRAE